MATKPYETDPLYELRGDLATTLGWVRLKNDDGLPVVHLMRVTQERLESMLDRVDEVLADKYDLHFIRSDTPMRDIKFDGPPSPPFPHGSNIDL